MKKVSSEKKIGPLAITAVVVLLVVSSFLTIKTWQTYFRPPTESGSESTVESSDESSLTDDPSPTQTPSPLPTQTEPSETQLPSPTPFPTPSPTPSGSPGDISDYSNVKSGWWYTTEGEPGVPASIPGQAQNLCDRFNGIWQGDTTEKKIYITMDVGYEYNNNTSKILDIAREKDFKISFFITGTIIRDESLRPLVSRMHNEGHLVGNHSWTHPSFPVLLAEKGKQAVVEEMRKVEDGFYEITGAKMPLYMRPPMGEYSEATMYLMDKMGYKSVFWSFAYRDWVTDDQPDRDWALERIKSNIHNGSILLLHTVSNTNVDILPDLVDFLRENGYEISLLE